MFKVRNEYGDEELQNLMIVARKSDGEILKIADPQVAAMLGNEYSVPVGDIPPLTDDLAPVEYYNSYALNLRSRSQ